MQKAAKIKTISICDSPIEFMLIEKVRSLKKYAHNIAAIKTNDKPHPNILAENIRVCCGFFNFKVRIKPPNYVLSYLNHTMYLLF